MTKFVSSHHPNGHSSDQTCTLKSADAKSDKWSLTEARIFAHALEMYGKNFCFIKKAIPWMPAKSIIEQYYKKVTNNSDSGTGGGSSGSSSGTSGGTTGGSSDFGGSSSQFPNSSSSTFNNCQRGGSGRVDDGAKDDSHNTSTTSAPKGSTSSLLSSLGSLDQLSEKMSDFQTLQVACLTSGGEYNASHNMKSLSCIDSKMGIPMMKSPLAYGGHVEEILGPEIKPVKAKPIFAPKVPEMTSNGHNGVISSPARGYLQFFQNGQLVLKLKGMNQGQWVQSEDSPCVPRHAKSKKCHKLNGKRQVAQITSHDGASSRASVLSEDLSADESSDDDSHGSSSIESRSLPSPSFGSCSVNASTNVNSSSCPPPMSRLTGSVKGASLARQDVSGNHLHHVSDHVNGSNGASVNVSAFKSKRDSSNLKNEECTCNDSDNCTCANNSTGTTNGNCNKNKKFKSCNGSASNRNTMNGLSSSASDTSLTATNDAGKVTRTTCNSPNRYGVKSSEVSANKNNHNGSSGRGNSHASASTNNASKCNATSALPPPLAHSSSAAVDLTSKNGSSCNAQQTPKTPTSGHKKSSGDSASTTAPTAAAAASGDFAVDLSVKANTNTKGLNSNSSGSSQYSRSSSLVNKSEAGKVTKKQIYSLAQFSETSYSSR